METEKDLLMYFQTCLRNMGLYTSLSFAALGYSRFYRDKNLTHNLYLIIFSIVFTFVTLYIGYYLIKDLNSFNKKVKSNYLSKWLFLPKLIMFFNIGAVILAIITLHSEIDSKTSLSSDKVEDSINKILF